VEGAFFDFIRQVGGDAGGAQDGGVQVFDGDRDLDSMGELSQPPPASKETKNLSENAMLKIINKQGP
jgi:hypothetical protein